MAGNQSLTPSLVKCSAPQADNCCEEAARVDQERLLNEKKEIRKAVMEIFAREEIQDILEKQCVSDELMRVWEEREEKEMKASGDIAPQMPAEVRGAVVWYMAHLVEHLGLPEKAWFDVVTLFDVYCSRASKVRPEGVQVCDMPMLSGVLAGLIKKADKAKCLSPQDVAVLQAVVNKLAAWLQQQGYQVNGYDRMATQVREEAVLKVMSWQINLPTVDPWISAFCARISAVTPQTLMPTLTWIWQQGLYLARNILLRHAATKDFRPRHVAQGLLALGFLTGRLLPIEALDLPELSAPEWAWLFPPAQREQSPTEARTKPAEVPDLQNEHSNGVQTAANLEDANKDARQKPPFPHHLLLLELLQVATGADLATLQKDCRQVFKSIRDLKSNQRKVIRTSL